jgi:hypothetical protein
MRGEKAMTKSLRLLTVSFALLPMSALGQNSDRQQGLAAVQQAMTKNKQSLQPPTHWDT